MEVKDGAKSECLIVMIKIESHDLIRKGADLHVWLILFGFLLCIVFNLSSYRNELFFLKT